MLRARKSTQPACPAEAHLLPADRQLSPAHLSVTAGEVLAFVPEGTATAGNHSRPGFPAGIPTSSST